MAPACIGVVRSLPHSDIKAVQRPKKSTYLWTKQVQSQQPGKFPDPRSIATPWRRTVERLIQSYEQPP